MQKLWHQRITMWPYSWMFPWGLLSLICTIQFLFGLLSKSLNDWSLEKLLPANVNDELFPSTGWLGKDSVGHYNDSACAWWVCGNVNGTFCGVQKISQWSYSRLCQERRIRCNKTRSLFIVFLHFGLIWLSTVTQYTSLFKGWTLCDIRTERWLLLV